MLLEVHLMLSQLRRLRDLRVAMRLRDFMPESEMLAQKERESCCSGSWQR